MNRFFLIAAIAFLSSCGTSNDDKAKSLIESSVKQSMHNPDSYQFVEMSPLVDAVEPYKATKEYETLYNKVNDLEHAILEYSAKGINESEIPGLKIQVDSLNNVIKGNEKSHKGEFVGYKTTFVFSGTNKLGVTVKAKKMFILDKELKTILHEINLTK